MQRIRFGMTTFHCGACGLNIIRMAEIIKIKKGLDIPLAGKADMSREITISPSKAGIVPADFSGFTWKLLVKPSDKVGKGTPVLQAKEHEGLYLTSPAAGEVAEINRGERRRILSVVIDCGKEGLETVKFTIGSDAEGITDALCRSGLWAMMSQRPYDIIPTPGIRPRDIFITAFDSAPLAPALIDAADQDALQAGIEMLSQLTDGKVYLGVRFGSGINATGAVVTEFEGPHPAGNVGTQIAAIKPVNKGETVWTLDARTAVRMGRLRLTGELDAGAKVAVTGPMVENPAMVKTVIGCDIASLLKPFAIKTEKKDRIISGNVLTGHTVSATEGYLRRPWRQVTVIAEGDNADEFMGWASLNPRKYSVKRSFPGFLRRHSAKFDFDARLRGGRRAPILSEEYDSVFPMDIYPEFLLRAIADNNIDKMEKLGIYEVAPEDFALPEFVDTSKLPLQQMVRDSLDSLRKEME